MEKHVSLACYMEASLDAISEGVLVLEGGLLANEYAVSEYLSEPNRFTLEASRGMLSYTHVPLMDVRSLPFFCVLVPLHNTENREEGLLALFPRHTKMNSLEYVFAVGFHYGDNASQSALTRIVDFLETVKFISVLSAIKPVYVDVMESCRAMELPNSTCINEKNPGYAWTIVLAKKICAYIHKCSEDVILHKLESTAENMEWFTSELAWNTKKECEYEHRLHSSYMLGIRQSFDETAAAPRNESMLYALCDKGATAKLVAAMRQECAFSRSTLFHVLDRMGRRSSAKLAVADGEDALNWAKELEKKNVVVCIAKSGRLVCFVKFRLEHVAYVLMDAEGDAFVKEILNSHTVNVTVPVECSTSGFERNARKEDLAMVMTVVWWVRMCYIPPDKRLMDDLLGSDNTHIESVTAFHHSRALTTIVHDSAVLQHAKVYTYNDTLKSDCLGQARSLQVDVLPGKIPDAVNNVPGQWRLLVAHGNDTYNTADVKYEDDTLDLNMLLNSKCYTVNLANVLSNGGVVYCSKKQDEELESSEAVRWLRRDVCIKFPAMLFGLETGLPNVVCARSMRVKINFWRQEPRIINKSCKFFHKSKTAVSNQHWVHIPRDLSLDTTSSWVKVYSTTKFRDLVKTSKKFLSKCKSKYMSLADDNEAQMTFSSKVLKRAEQVPHKFFLQAPANMLNTDFEEAVASTLMIKKLFDTYPSYEFSTKLQIYPIGIVLEEKREIKNSKFVSVPIYAYYWGLESIMRVLTSISVADDAENDKPTMRKLFLQDTAKCFMEFMEFDLTDGIPRFRISRAAPDIPLFEFTKYMATVLKSTYDPPEMGKKSRVQGVFDVDIDTNANYDIPEKLKLYNELWTAAENLGI